MNKDLAQSNLQRRKEDGSHDSICLTCLATISTQATSTGSETDAMEYGFQAHVCGYSFDPNRSILRI